MKQTARKVFAVSFICFFFFHCSFKAPSVPEISVKRLQIETETRITAERLSVFLIYLDEDGKDDYNTITVIHQDTGLQWSINRFNASFFVSEYETDRNKQTRLWIGSDKLTPPHGRVPQGVYSIIAEDLAGNQTVKTINLTAGLPLKPPPFSFSVSDNKWRITADKNSHYTVYSLILLGADRQPLFVKKTDGMQKGALEGDLNTFKERYPDARYIQCMAENAEGSAAYLTAFYTLY